MVYTFDHVSTYSKNLENTMQMRHDTCPQEAYELVEGQINQTMHKVTKTGRSERPTQWKNSTSSRSLGKGTLGLSLE